MLSQKAILNKIRTEVKEYLVSNKLKSCVLGVSGGIDSAIVAAIVKPVCKKLKITLIGVSLPSSSNKKEEIDRANLVLDAYCNEGFEINIDEMSASMYAMTDAHKNKVRRGNIKARIRMIMLYDKAQETGGLVLSTDNYTELLLGFWTLHGDVGDLSPIQYLFKTEVYELAKYIVENECNEEEEKALQLCIDAVPTDGLGITNSDMESIGLPTYKEIDEELKKMWCGKKTKKCIADRNKRTNFKRNNPYSVLMTRDSKCNLV